MNAVDGELDRFEHERTQQRSRAVLHTSGLAWRTAALMTCLLTPLGPLFGVAALAVLRGLHASIETGDETRAQHKLRLGRAIVLSGTALGLLSSAISLFAMFSMLREVSETLDQARQHQRPSFQPEEPSE